MKSGFRANPLARELMWAASQRRIRHVSLLAAGVLVFLELLFLADLTG